MNENKLYLPNYEKLDYRNLYTVVHPVPGMHNMPHMHWHPQYEIMLIRSGSYTLRNNRTEISREGCSVFIHCPYSLHNMNSLPPKIYARDLIYMDPRMFTLFSERCLPQTAFSGASLLFAAPTEEEMEELSDLAAKAASLSDDRITGALYLAALLRRILAIINSGRGETIRTEFSYIQDILRYMAENIAVNHTLDSLAHQYSVSVSKLQRDFFSVTGTSFHRYRTMLRQIHAKEMLLGGESIIKTSLECGYSSESHFIQSFRRYWGITPCEFMKKTRK